MLLCSSIEELKNVWLPFSIRMKMTKNKGLDVCNWTDGDEVQVVEKLGIRDRRCGRSRAGGGGTLRKRTSLNIYQWWDFPQ